MNRPRMAARADPSKLGRSRAGHFDRFGQRYLGISHHIRDPNVQRLDRAGKQFLLTGHDRSAIGQHFDSSQPGRVVNARFRTDQAGQARDIADQHDTFGPLAAYEAT